MRELIVVSNNVAGPSPYAITISEFKILKGQDLGAVYFFADHISPYAAYDNDEREVKICQDLKIKFTTKVHAAIDKYNELSETHAVKLLKAARHSINKLEEYFRTIDLTAIDDHGKPIYSAKDLITNLEKMGKVVEGLDKLEELVKKQQAKNNPNRGGVVTNKYSS